MVRRVVGKLMVLLGIAFSPATWGAVELRFGQPDYAADEVAVALKVSGLVTGVAPALSVYDVDVGFDAAVLMLTGVRFGDPVLGDQLELDGLGGVTPSAELIGPGTLNLFALSVASAEQLNSRQADTFTLAILLFAPAAAGSSPLTLSVNAFGDAYGNALEIVPLAGRIDSVVPLPAGVWLLLSGLLGLAGRSRLDPAGRRS